MKIREIGPIRRGPWAPFHHGRPRAKRDAATGHPPPLAPADEAAPGTPGTGEAPCPRCGGNGTITTEDGPVHCPDCGGSGRVNRAIGGG